MVHAGVGGEFKIREIACHGSYWRAAPPLYGKEGEELFVGARRAVPLRKEIVVRFNRTQI